MNMNTSTTLIEKKTKTNEPLIIFKNDENLSEKEQEKVKKLQILYIFKNILF
jgi:hypothetical protein